MIWYTVLKAIHLLCAVAWVGGMLFALLVLRPSLGVLEAPQRLLVHNQVFKRFFLIVWHAVPLILISGVAMVVFFMGGFAAVPPKIHAMFGLGVLMALIFCVIYFGPYKRFTRTTDRQVMAASVDNIRKLILTNLILGVVTIVVATVG